MGQALPGQKMGIGRARFEAEDRGCLIGGIVVKTIAPAGMR
jgi:hypothetical protein